MDGRGGILVVWSGGVSSSVSYDKVKWLARRHAVFYSAKAQECKACREYICEGDEREKRIHCYSVVLGRRADDCMEARESEIPQRPLKP